MARATTRSINAALKRAGIDAEFCNNRDGYSYFGGKDVEFAESTSVYTCYVGDLTVDQWVEYARGFAAESAKRKAELADAVSDSTMKFTKITKLD